MAKPGNSAEEREEESRRLWAKARTSLKLSGAGCLLIVIPFLLIAVYAAGYLAALNPACLRNMAEHSTPS